MHTAISSLFCWTITICWLFVNPSLSFFCGIFLLCLIVHTAISHHPFFIKTIFSVHIARLFGIKNIGKFSINWCFLSKNIWRLSCPPHLPKRYLEICCRSDKIGPIWPNPGDLLGTIVILHSIGMFPKISLFMPLRAPAVNFTAGIFSDSLYVHVELFWENVVT